MLLAKCLLKNQDHQHMTEGCQLMPKIKYSTVRDTAHRQECKQVDEEQHHPVTWQVCEEVNYMVKCSDMIIDTRLRAGGLGGQSDQVGRVDRCHDPAR